MSGIFETYAPKYWAAGLPVIPLQGKRPRPLRWQTLADQMPEEDVQAEWLAQYPDANMGLPLGPQSGMVAFDIDTDDPRIISVLLSVLPKSPWKRVGKKGMALMYRYSGQRTFRIKKRNEDMICEVLSKSAQLVLPPSIHPDTGNPYQANADLLEVRSILPELPKDVESLIRGALESAGVDISLNGWSKISAFVPAGARDNALVSHAGILARAVTRGERTLMEAIAEIEHWVNTFPERVAGDKMDPNKGVERLIQFVARDVLGEKRRTLPVGWDNGLTDEDKERMGLKVVEDRVQWDSETIQNFLVNEFSRHDVGSPGQMAAVEQALGRMVDNDSIGSLEVERLMRWIVDSSGKVVTVAVLKKRLAELQKGEIAGHDHAEIAKTVLREMSEYGEIRHHNSQFWQWKGAAWEVKQEFEILKYIAEEYGHLPACRKASDHKGIVSVIRSLAEKDLKQIDVPVLNFANGVLLEDLTIQDHNPDFGMTYVLPYRYMPEEAGKCPKFFEFLQSVWGHEDDYEDRVLALQEAIAVTMFGQAPRYQRVICLYGVAKSGKSTLMEIVRNMFPDEAVTSCPPQDWNDKFAPATMNHKLINVCGELPESSMIPGDKFKQIVVGEEITGQFKGKPLFQFRPMCAHWFSTNHLPRTRDTSIGFVRRWLFMSFTKVVPDNKLIIGLDKQIIADEREAIVAWAVQAILRIQEQNSYTLPRSHKYLEGEVANQNNSVRFFLTHSGKVRVGPAVHRDLPESEIWINETPLHDKYWASSLSVGGVQPVGLRSFRSKMRELMPDFGFELRMRTDPRTGQEHAEYKYITLVK